MSERDVLLSANRWTKKVRELREKEVQELKAIIELEEFNDAQMINGTYEGDTISLKSKRGIMARRRLKRLLEIKQSKRGLNTDSGNPHREG